MPHIWDKDNSKVAVSLDELIPAWFPSYQALHKNIQRTKNKDYGIKRLQRGCFSNEVLIDFDTLPRGTQQELGDPRKCSHIMERWYKIDAGAVAFYPNHPIAPAKYLSPDLQEEYILNASVLLAIRTYREAHEQELQRKGKKAKKIYEFMALECQHFQEILKTKHKGQQHTLPASDRRFREVYDAFFTGEKPNYESLISGKIQNDNARVVTDKLTALLDSMFAKGGSKPNKLMVAKKYQLFLEGMLDVIVAGSGEMYDPKDFKPISDRSITKWLSSWESKIGTYPLRSGDRIKTRGLLSVSYEFDLPTYAGSIISVDDRQPPFEYGPSQRLWLYKCLDVASGAITATVWAKDKKDLIIEFYRQIVRNYTEWGVNHPHELEGELSLNASYRDTFLRDGAMFQKVRLHPNNPRGKIIERRFRDFRLIYEKELPGFIGRWHARDESNQPMPKDNIYREQKYIPYGDLVEQSISVVERYNNSAHPTKTDISRWNYFMTMQHPELRPTNWKGILPYLGYCQKTSCNVGKIRLQGVNLLIADQGCILFGEALIERLKVIEGQEVTAYYLDGNDGKLLKVLIYMNDTFICEGIPTPKANKASLERTEQDDINLRIQARYVSTVEGYMNSRKRSIEEVVLIDRQPKTLNNDFKMPGVSRAVSQTTGTGAIMDSVDDEDMDIPEYSPKTSQMHKY